MIMLSFLGALVVAGLVGYGFYAITKTTKVNKIKNKDEENKFPFNIKDND
jgi:hypothetical protein